MSLLNQAFAAKELRKKGKINEQQYKDMMYKIQCQTTVGADTLVNISKTPTSIEWFIDDRIIDNKVSAAEKLIAGILGQYKVKWYQEVSMYGIRLPTYGYARYDFLVQVGNPYILIEYDGERSHASDYQKKRDALKTKWCKDMGIILVRYTKEHYYRMDAVLDELLVSYGIDKKK